MRKKRRNLLEDPSSPNVLARLQIAGIRGAWDEKIVVLADLHRAKVGRIRTHWKEMQ